MSKKNETDRSSDDDDSNEQDLVITNRRGRGDPECDDKKDWSQGDPSHLLDAFVCLFPGNVLNRC